MTAVVESRLFDAGFLRRLESAGLLAKRLAGQFAAPSAATRPGAKAARSYGDGLDLADHRPYVPGDDVRFIDWPAWSRSRRLTVREFHEHRSGEVLVLLDCSASMSAGAGAFDAARRSSAVLAYTAMCGGQHVRVQPFAAQPGRPISAGPDPTRILPVLRGMEALEADGTTDLPGCVRRLLPGLGPVGAVVVVSDFAETIETLPEAFRLLRAAGPRWQIAAMHLVRPEDEQPVFAGEVLLRAAESDRRVALHVGPAERQAYARWWTGFVGRLQRALGRVGGLYQALPTDQHCERTVLGLLHQLGRIEP